MLHSNVIEEGRCLSIQSALLLKILLVLLFLIEQVYVSAYQWLSSSSCFEFCARDIRVVCYLAKFVHGEQVLHKYTFTL